MSNEPRTVEQWLALDDLPVKLAEATRKAEHAWIEPAVYYGTEDPLGYVIKCRKCGHIRTPQEVLDGCSVPDPITIDWNTAMKWRDEACRTDAGLELFYQAMTDICEEEPVDYLTDDDGFNIWLFRIVQAKDYLIAAAMAAERKEE